MYTKEKVDQWMEEATRIARDLQALGKSFPHALDQLALADVAEAAARGNEGKAQNALAALRRRLELVTAEYEARLDCAEHTGDLCAPREAKYWHR